MTSTAGRANTTQHPDVSEISDLTEGLLSPTRSAAVRRHLDSCPLCADVRSSLEEIRGLLGTLPGPPRMPAEIAGRIDAALAAEALLNATTPESDTAVSRETARTTAEAAPAVPPRPVTARAADRPAGRSGATTGPGRTGKPRRRRIALLSTIGAAFGAVLLGTSLYLSQTGNVTAGGDAGSAKKADTVAGAALSPFSGSPVEDRVHALLAEGDTAQTPRGIAPESMSAETENTAPERNRDSTVPGCVLAGTGRSDAVLEHERGEYRGSPAYLLILPDRGDSTRVQAYVLDASCANRTTGSGSPAADLLFSETYPRS
ncbi:zf-HC2 domain-containing protein [Streptomyces sp. NBC_00572]|uniref:zf-HC2 domain-containing protein n=1 Tax=Streptomyces sp. NBC_00572 TaxID=2903664 RepID=UPI002257B9CD|nr:zf-HC2 domain-containing protein [Streptomyces sp. NBC_00572]MCX4982112.1 zf-HC2 domain-containing protein [Streptomyces sp. NBC_00572]